MPIIQFSELNILLCQGIITSFTLDTNIVRELKFNFKTPPLNMILNDFNNINFVMSDFSYREVLKKCNEFYLEKYDTIRNALRERVLIDEFSTALKHIENIDIRKRCEAEIDKFFSPKDCYIFHTDEYVDINVIVDMYFNTHPPFGNAGKKKYEFPDAIILNSLEQNASKCEKNILLISKDNDWLEYCKISKRLYMIDQDSLPNKTHILRQCISEFSNLNTFISTTEDKIKKLIYESHDIEKNIEEKIKKYLDDTSIVDPVVCTPYYYDYEIDCIDFIEAYFDQTQIDIGYIIDGTAQIYLTVPIDITCYASITLSIWDSDDKEEIVIDTKSVVVDCTTDIYLDMNLNLHDIDNITLDDIENFSIIENNFEVDFGEI